MRDPFGNYLRKRQRNEMRDTPKRVRDRLK